MKKLLLLSLLLTYSLVNFGQTIYNIEGHTDDITYYEDGTLWGWVGQSTSRIGMQGGKNTANIIPFQIPVIPPGKIVTAASLSINLISVGNSPIGNMDIFGLDSRASSAVNSTYYSGGIKVYDNAMTSSTSLGVVTVSGPDLIDYLNTQMTPGNHDKYLFIRLIDDKIDEANYQYWTIDTSDGLIKPLLSVTMENSGVNLPPVLDPIGDQTAIAGQSKDVNISASDPNSDPLSFSISNNPVGITLTDNTDGTAIISIADNIAVGEYNNIVITVSDGTLDDTETIKVTIASSITDIVAETSDQGIYYDNSSAWVGSTYGRIGRTNGGRSVFIIPFKVPNISASNTVIDATLDFFIESKNDWGKLKGHIDIIGIDNYRWSNFNDVWVPDDYSFGGPVVGSDVVDSLTGGDQSSFTPLHIQVQTAELVDFINTQIADGATSNDYIFFRVESDEAQTQDWLYWQISTANSTTPSQRPTLRITQGTTSTPYTWYGTTNSTWTEATNWDGGNIPSTNDGSEDVVINVVGASDHNPLLTSNLNLSSLIVEKGTLEIPESIVVKVDLGLTNKVNGSVKILSSNSGTGSLIVAGDITNDGDFEVQRYLDPTATWQVISSPMDNEKSNSFLGYSLNEYDQDQGDFLAITSTTHTLTPGEGFVTKKGSSTVNPVIFNLSNPNNGDDIVHALTTTSWSDPNYPGEGNTHFHLSNKFNLVGNPYTSNISWDDLYTLNHDVVDASFYTYYDKNGNGTKAWEAQASGNISIGQGFAVILKSSLNTGNFNFYKSTRTNTATSFRKKNNLSNNSFKLLASNNGNEDEIEFILNSNASFAYDGKYDGYKFNPFGNSPTPYFVSSDNKRLDICQQPESESVELGFNMAVSGDVKLSLNGAEGFTSLVLEDKVENKFIDLLKSDYSYYYSTSDKETGRFAIHLNRSTLGDNEIIVDNTSIYTSNSILYIEAKEDLNNVRLNIFSMNGQIVYSNNFSEIVNESITLNIPNGIYIVEINSDLGRITKRINLNK